MMKKTLLLSLIFTTCFLGFSQDRIIGGREIADIIERPYMVGLYKTSNDNHFCGGTIIDNEWIITAAHCIDDKQKENFYIKAGILSQYKSNQKSAIEAFIIHPDYVSTSTGSDIAILKLKEPLVFNTEVKKIDYATTADAVAGLTDPGVIATVSGWGAINEEQTKFAKFLKTLDVPIVSLQEANKPASYDGDLNQTMIPAGFQSGVEDACGGDSGGPLVVPDATANNVILAGVVSFGEGCARPNKYGVYARVSYFDQWITSIVSGNVVANFSIPKFTEIGSSVTTTNLSFNGATSFEWKVKDANGMEVVNSQDNTLRFTPSSAGIFEITLVAKKGSSTNSVIKKLSVLSAPLTCQSTTFFDKNSLRVITEDGKNFTGSAETPVVGVEFPTIINSVEKVTAVAVYFKTPIGISTATTSTVNVYIIAGTINVRKRVNLSTIISSVNSSGKFIFVLDEPIYISGDIENWELELEMINSFDNNEEIIVMASAASNSDYSYFYDKDINSSFNYGNLDLAIEPISCIYDTRDLVTTTQKTLDVEIVTLSPNPVNKNASITINTAQTGFLKIFSPTGSVVFESSQVNPQEQIQLSDQLTSGVYFWNFIASDHQGISQGKIIIK